MFQLETFFNFLNLRSRFEIDFKGNVALKINMNLMK